MEQLVVNSLTELATAANKFLKDNSNCRQFAIYGQMGAGKTTFIKALCSNLFVTDIVSSPTFSIINEYSSTLGYKVFHFDFYRIKNLDEVFNLGYEDYFYSNEYCFIEWPELVEELLPDHIVKVNIDVLPDGKRVISLK